MPAIIGDWTLRGKLICDRSPPIMPSMFTAAQVAKQLGVAAYTVRRTAHEHGIGQRLGPDERPLSKGVRVGLDNRPWVFQAEDAERLKPLINAGSGRPPGAKNRPKPAPKRRKSFSRKA